MIDWNDSQKRKSLREALQAVYPTPGELEMFVDEELNENLSVVAGGNNLEVTAFSLLKWARSKEKLDVVYEAFKRENPNHSVVLVLERQNFVPQTKYLSSSDWDQVFTEFQPQDFADIHRAFFKAFQITWGADFQRIYPQSLLLTDPLHIRELLVLPGGNTPTIFTPSKPFLDKSI